MKQVNWIIFFLLIFNEFSVFGQQDSTVKKSVGYVSLNAGFSFTESDFLPAYGEKPQASYIVNCTAVYPLYKNHIAVTAKLSYGENTSDINTYNHFNNESGNNYYHSWALGGLHYNITSKNTIVYVSFLAGLAYVNSPKIELGYSEYSPNGYGGTDTTNIKEGKTLSFAYNIGVGIVFTPHERFSVMFNVDYYSTNTNNGPQVNDVGSSSQGSPYFTFTRYYKNFQTPISVCLLCFSVGCAYRITK